MERLNHIRVRVQLLLLVLLIATTGLLCREQTANRVQSSTVSVLTQAPDSHTANALRNFVHAILASDIPGGIVSENYTKVQEKQIDAPGGSAYPKPQTSPEVDLSSTIPPPLAKDYYIFSLGKIRI